MKKSNQASATRGKEGSRTWLHALAVGLALLATGPLLGTAVAEEAEDLATAAVEAHQAGLPMHERGSPAADEETGKKTGITERAVHPGHWLYCRGPFNDVKIAGFTNSIAADIGSSTVTLKIGRSPDGASKTYVRPGTCAYGSRAFFNSGGEHSPGGRHLVFLASGGGTQALLACAKSECCSLKARTKRMGNTYYSTR